MTDSVITYQETDRPSRSKAAGPCWIMIEHPSSREPVYATATAQTLEVETGTTLRAYGKVHVHRKTRDEVERADWRLTVTGNPDDTLTLKVGAPQSVTVTVTGAVLDSHTPDPSLPALVGSPKQVQWATRIRAEVLEQLDEYDGPEGRLHSDTEARDQIRQIARKALVGMTKASYWIDQHKHVLNHSALEQEGEAELLVDHLMETSVIPPADKRRIEQIRDQAIAAADVATGRTAKRFTEEETENPS